MKEFKEALFQLFSGWVIVLHFTIYVALYTGYLYIATNKLTFSLVAAVIAAVPSLYFISYKNRKAKKEGQIIKELNKYATTMTFQLQSGKNVAEALRETMAFVSPELRKDIQKTLEIKEKKAVLDTEHFKKYKFAALNAFHENLRIKDDKGGDTREMFGRSNKLINNSIADRDMQIKEKSHKAMSNYMALAIGLGIIPFLRYTTKGMYLQFTEVAISAPFVTVFFLIMLVTLFLQESKKASNEMAG